MKATMSFKFATREYVNKQLEKEVDYTSMEVNAQVFLVNYIPHKDIEPVELFYFLVLPNGAVTINHRDLIDHWDHDEDDEKLKKALTKPAYNIKTQTSIYNRYKIMNNVQLLRDAFITTTVEFNPVTFTFVETRKPKYSKDEACNFILSQDGKMQTFINSYIEERTSFRNALNTDNYMVTDLGDWNII